MTGAAGHGQLKHLDHNVLETGGNGGNDGLVTTGGIDTKPVLPRSLARTVNAYPIWNFRIVVNRHDKFRILYHRVGCLASKQVSQDARAGS